MNIAIIEDNQDYIELLKLKLDIYLSKTDFFENSPEFGKADLKKYDVIIADYNLPNSVNGRDLLRSIQSKTNAELFLMSASTVNFVESDVNNNNINGFIDKINVSNVIDMLKYCDVKIRINRIVKSESAKFEYIVSNGFSTEIINDSLIIRINNILSDNSKKKIMEKIDTHKIKKAIIAYPNLNTLKSSDLRTIVFLFNSFKSKKIKMVFWNLTKKSDIKNQLHSCRLDFLFQIFDTLEECLTEFRNTDYSENDIKECNEVN